MPRLPSLFAALLLVLAGCSGVVQPSADTPTPTPEPTPADTPTPTDSATDTGSYYRSYEVTARETSPERVARRLARSRIEVREDVNWRADSFTVPLFENGSTVRVETAGHPAESPGPYENGTLIHANGSVYTLRKRVVDNQTGTGYRVRLTGPLSPDRHDDYDRAEREAVAFESLSGPDQRLFGYAAPTRETADSGVRTAGYTYVFRPGGAGNATLVDGERHYVRYQGDRYRVVLDDRVEGAVRYRVRYDRQQVADSLRALFEQRRDDLVVTLNASAEPPVRGFVARVIENEPAEWAGERTEPHRFRATEEWARHHSVPGRRAYVRHEGTLYEVRVLKTVE